MRKFCELYSHRRLTCTPSRRFTMVFQRENLILLFTRADSGTLELLQHILTHPLTQNMLFIGACRSIDTPSLENFMDYLTAKEEVSNELCSLNFKVNVMHLEPLSAEFVTQILCDMLRMDPEKVRELASLVVSRTGVWLLLSSRLIQ